MQSLNSLIFIVLINYKFFSSSQIYFGKSLISKFFSVSGWLNGKQKDTYSWGSVLVDNAANKEGKM